VDFPVPAADPVLENSTSPPELSSPTCRLPRQFCMNTPLQSGAAPALLPPVGVRGCR
jgi:hypothetical protein